MADFEPLITTEEREEVEACVRRVNEVMNVGAMLAELLPDFIDARMPDHEAG